MRAPGIGTFLMTVVTRFAPSPTGMLHLGGVRTALFSWLYARRTGGRFILRVEDTDRERSTDEAVRVILDGMTWLGLDADEGPYFQSQRFDRYREVIAEMLKAGSAYHCYCTKEELEALREQQIARKEKPRYTGICRERSAPRAGVSRGSSIALAQELVDRTRGLAFAAFGTTRFRRRRPGVDVEMQPAPGVLDKALQKQRADDRACERARRCVVDVGDLRIEPGVVGRP